MPDLIIKPTTTSGNKLILKDQAGGAVLTTADSGATLGNSTQDNITRLGTVTSGIVKSSDYGYVQMNLNGDFSSGAAGNIIAIGGTSATQRFILTGDTTNFVTGSSNNSLKIVKKGIYLIIFSIQVSDVATEERNVWAEIRGFGDGSTSTLAKGHTQVQDLDSNDGWAGCSSSYIGLCAANAEINFFTGSGSQGNATIDTDTHASIVLIREVV